jgi:hypothetical protein
MTGHKKIIVSGTGMDGYTTQPLTEGYIRKGGMNPPVSQIQVRPAPPASMHPTQQPAASNSNGTNTTPKQSNS